MTSEQGKRYGEGNDMSIYTEQGKTITGASRADSQFAKDAEVGRQLRSQIGMENAFQAGQVDAVNKVKSAEEDNGIKVALQNFDKLSLDQAGQVLDAALRKGLIDEKNAAAMYDSKYTRSIMADETLNRMDAQQAATGSASSSAPEYRGSAFAE